MTIRICQWERRSMNLNYIRRFRMELQFADVWLPEVRLPENYFWQPWSGFLIDRHAAVKLASFRSEIDATIFPCLSHSAGCRDLMLEIARHKTFLSGATWLLVYCDPQTGIVADCATIQGMKKRRKTGSIQNVGVIPEHRGLGLGRALLLQSLRGFRDARMKRVSLEVTADNLPAVSLYESLGFRVARTTFKAVQTEPEFAF
jgi:hypothetical protein